MSSLNQRLGAELEQIRAANLYRTRRVVDGSHGAQIMVEGRTCINFCSNDYLGLASDPRLAEAAKKSLGESGTGSGAAALVSGYNREHQALEEELAAATGYSRALLFSSGWAANLGVIRALLGKEDVLIADELNHASLIDGGRLSGARYVRVKHGDVAGYAVALQSRDSEKHRLVVTDSIFSMDGDGAPLAELSILCRQHNAALMVDDAHGFCAFPNPESRIPNPDIYVATLGKALGCSGAFVAGSENLIEYLVQRARSWVFSTAPPPAIAAAARCALAIARSAEGGQRRQQLKQNIARFRAGCAQRGIPLAPSQTAIQPLIVGDEARALALSRHLFEQGLWVVAIRPPTVPRGTARLRITLSAAHSTEQIDQLMSGLYEAWTQGQHT